MAQSVDRTPGARTHSPTTRRPSDAIASIGSTLIPAIDGPKVSMTVATMRRDSHSPQACSGGSTALICRNVSVLTSAAPRDRSEPRPDAGSVMQSSQHKMVTLVNGNVGAPSRVAGRTLRPVTKVDVIYDIDVRF